MNNRSQEVYRHILDNLENQPAAFFKRLIDASSAGVIITDAVHGDQPVVYVNPAFETLTGYSAAEVQGRNCRFLQKDDRGQPEIAEIRHCIAHAGTCTVTLRNYRKDGSMFWSRMHLFPVQTGGTVTHFVSFLDDISAKVEAQHAAAQARERLSAVLESISDGCFSIDRDWRFTYVNAKGATWIARDPEQLVGKHIWKEFPEAVGGPFYETYRRAMEQHEFANCEAYYEPLDIWLEARAYPSRDGITVFFADVSERKAAEKRLVHLANHDSLTGLDNRLSCLRALDAAMTRGRAAGRPVGVLFVDLDRFKEVNDTYGHRAGDLALQEIGRRLHRFADADTVVARISGDGFVFVLEGAQDDRARNLAVAVLQQLALPIGVDDHQIAIGASIGIAIGDGDDALTPDELLNNADTAMYEAKANGRHTYAVFSPAACRLVKERLLLRQELFSALERHQFLLYYQPQVSAASGAVVGAEALLRWNHPRLGLLAPSSFLQMLEDSTAMTLVGAWVCEEACRQAREWELAGYRLRMAVNVSARQLTDENLPPLLKGLVALYSLDAECIKLEVTESMLVQDIDKAAAVLRSLQRDGFRIALDDFGTGYSNLSYLRQLPITTIKIDRSFVQEIEQDRRCLDIVNGVIAFAKSLHMDVICEGIETEAQKAAIRSTGCDVLQGYLIGKPMRAADFHTLLLAQADVAGCQ